LSRIERGERRIYLSDYLLRMQAVREAAPDHPGVTLYSHINRRTRRAK
jgi:hypothetical protein